MTYREILASIVKTLKNLPGDIDVQTQDIEEGFARPSFFVEFEDIKTANYMGTSRTRTIPVKIVYFPTHEKKNQGELLEMRDQLEEFFVDSSRIEVYPGSVDREQAVIEVSNAEFLSSKDLIEFVFDIYTDEKIEQEQTGDTMEELELKEELNKG